MTEVNYYYYIMILEDGTQIPCIKIHNDDEYKLIEGIGTREFRSSNVVSELIDKIKEINSTIYIYHFNLELKISHEFTSIIEDTYLLRNCTLSTKKLLEILIGWYNFLVKYENEEIPGIIYQKSV